MSLPQEAKELTPEMEAEIKAAALIYVKGDDCWLDDTYPAHRQTFEAGARIYAQKLQAEREQCKRDMKTKLKVFSVRIDADKIKMAQFYSINLGEIFRQAVDQEIVKREGRCPTCGWKEVLKKQT